MTSNETALRGSIVSMWGEDSAHVKIFDEMIQKQSIFATANAALRGDKEALEIRKWGELREIRAGFKKEVLDAIDSIYDINNDKYKIHYKYIAAIKKKVLNLPLKANNILY